MLEWLEQLQNRVNSLERLKKYIAVTPDEEHAIKELNTIWGTTPYFASLMDRDDPDCPIRRQVVPSLKEKDNVFGIPNYLIWKENRDTEEKRPECIGRQYEDRVCFTVTKTCAQYCRYCFRRELVLDQEIEFNLDIDAGLEWLKEHKEVRDVLVTGGDPFLLPGQQII